jgi:hypothetical protein
MLVADATEPRLERSARAHDRLSRHGRLPVDLGVLVEAREEGRVSAFNKAFSRGLN